MSVTLDEVKKTIARLCDIIIDNEVYFCELDSVAGDGDFGMSIAKGFKEVKRQLDEINDVDIAAFIKGCALIITEHCGGASGPIWGSGFRAAAKSVQGKETMTLDDIAGLFEAAIVGIQKRGGAAQGEKTLLDALIPATEATKNMIASKGRASYVGDRSLHYPDAGAMAISVILREFVS